MIMLKISEINKVKWIHIILEDIEGVIWRHLETFGDIWRHLETFGDIWRHLETFRDI